MEKRNHDINLVILYSGGADSRLMLEFALKQGKVPHCVLIDYSQEHNQELKFAKQQLNKLKVSYQIIELKGLGLNSALTGNLVSGRFGPNISQWHVPGRNTMFVSIAFSIAENLGIGEIWLGADYSDIENDFVDCKQDFITKVNELFQVNGSYPIKLRAPLLGMEKDSIKNMLKDFGVSEDEIFSGYGELETWTTSSNDVSNSSSSTVYIDCSKDFPNYVNSDTYNHELLYNKDHNETNTDEMLYIRYIHLSPVCYDDDVYSIPPGIYRLEGFDPLDAGFGILYCIPNWLYEFPGHHLKDFESYCKIIDLETVRNEIKQRKG